MRSSFGRRGAGKAVLFFAAKFAALSLVSTPADAAVFLELQGPSVIVRYEEGSEGAAREMILTVPRLRRELEGRTGLPYDFSFAIDLYRDRGHFHSLAGSDMVAAFAIPGVNKAVIDLSRMSVHPLNLERITLHEMCHLLLHRHVGPGLLPKWLDEGVAQWVSGGMNEIVSPGPDDVLRQAVMSGTLLRFSDLAGSFPAERAGVSLAYAQSLDFVTYLGETHGEEAIREVLFRLSRGESLPGAFRDTMGADFEAIVDRWHGRLLLRYTWLTYLTDNFSWLLFVAGGLLTICGFLRLRRRIKDHPDEEEPPVAG